jgi:phosphoglycerate dehydrogenase-like enzyme
MESKESKDLELNILVFGWNPEYKKVFEEGFQKEFKDYPNFHSYIIVSNFEEELEKLKGVKLDILCSFPSLEKYIQYALKNFPTIKWVHSLAAGVERFLKLDEISKNENLIFSNSKGAYSEALGEVGIASMMYFSYNLYSYTEAMKNKQWSRSLNKTLYNKTLLIMGYGNNGVCLAKIAKPGFNMKVIGVNRTKRDDVPGKEYTDELYSIKDLPDKVINEADYIYATLPSNSETDNIFDKNFFNKMNKDAVFINVGRGNAVNEDDIIEALEKDVIRGAALDVTKKEPLNKDSKLYNISPSKLLLSNHSLCHVPEGSKNGFECFVNNLKNYLKTGKPINIVDKIREY